VTVRIALLLSEAVAASAGVVLLARATIEVTAGWFGGRLGVRDRVGRRFGIGGRGVVFVVVGVVFVVVGVVFVVVGVVFVVVAIIVVLFRPGGDGVLDGVIVLASAEEHQAGQGQSQ
jgi:hypothetical protein